jgi:hypothetical protein
VNKDLPHGAVSQRLLEVVIPSNEVNFEEQLLDLLEGDEALYETRTPLLLRAIASVGCVTRLSLQQRAYQQKPQQIYNLKDLEFVNTASHPYLTATVASYRRVFMYCATDRARSKSGLGVIGLFFIDSTNVDDEVNYKAITENILQEYLQSRGLTDERNVDIEEMKNLMPSVSSVGLSAKAFVWVSAGQASAVASTQKPPFQRIFQRIKYGSTAVSVKFNTTIVAKLSDCIRACNDRIATYASERRGPTLVIVQGNLTALAGSNASDNGT